MPDQIKKEKREFVRAPLSIEARVKLIDIGDAEQKRALKSEFASSFLSAGAKAAPDQLETNDATLVYLMEFMFQINQKLDKVISLLNQEELKNTHIEIKETVNISGSGISMIVSSSLKVGQLLDISLFIPDFPIGIFSVQGEVIRVEPRTGAESGLYEIGIQFLNLSEDERERLIAYTFRQQRKTIRDIKDND